MKKKMIKTLITATALANGVPAENILLTKTKLETNSENENNNKEKSN